MGFDYDKLKSKHEEQNQWASYSDLFMVLSVVFLLLYVTTSLRGGTTSLQNNIEYQELMKEVTELRQEIKAYETIKEDHLAREASKSEQENYKELMSKLDLLQEDAQKEADELMQQAEENQKKKTALNKYQKMIQNIINANVVAKSRIVKRDKTIVKKDLTIEEKKQVIAEKRQQIQMLNQDIQEKEKEIQSKESKIISNNEKIQEMNLELESKISQIEKERQEGVRKQREAKKLIAEMRAKAQARIEALKDQNKTVERQMNRIERELASASNLLEKKNQEIQSQAERRKALQARLQREKLRAQQVQEELNTEAQKRAELDSKLQEESQKTSQLNSKLQQEEEKRSQLAAALKQTKNEVASKESKISDLTKEFKAKLAQERAKANARKNLIANIKKNFKNAGIKAKIDGKTGEVILEFGDEYFDTGQANLKENMQKILNKSVPIYAQSLFQKKEIAKKIANVEIVGFASPTYKGKFVDPDSLKPEDQKATSYNLDLSYRRAKSIFDHVFDTRKMTFEEQARLRKIIKVTGRGYLDVANEIKTDRNTASSISSQQFCQETDCKKYQRVIIKFNLKN
ncbi:MAG: hypothetical protein R2827_07040 [Bdellovibrionales bacterium]